MTADQMTKLAQQHPDQVYEKMLEVVAKIKQGGGDPGAFLKEFGISAGRQEQQIEALASKVDLLKKNLATAENPTGGANKYAEDMKNDFDKAVNEMTTAWTELKEQLGQDIFPAAITGAKMLAGAIHEVTEFLKGMDGSNSGRVGGVRSHHDLCGQPEQGVRSVGRLDQRRHRAVQGRGGCLHGGRGSCGCFRHGCRRSGG